jgi:flagellar basal body-associated protein FliL
MRQTDKQGSQGKKAVEFYAALVLALALAAIAGVLYFYAMFLEARARQQRKHIAELERSNEELRRELQQTRALLDRELEHSRTLWPEMLDETGDLSRN